MADIKNYGLTGIAANVQLGKNGGYLSFSNDVFSLETNGGSDADLSLGNATVSGLVTFGSLSDGSITIASFIDDDTMATASNTTLATSESIKAYVDAQLTGASLSFTDDAGTASLSIDLDSEALTFAGGNNITTSGSGNTLTIDLDDNVTLAGNLTAVDGTFSGAVGITGDLTVTGNIIGNGGASGSITGIDTLSANNIVAAEDITIAGFLVNGVIDDDTMATASNTTLATSESVKAYVDAQATAASLTFTDDAATAGLVIDLDSETLTIAGGDNITTSGSGNSLTVSLDADISLTSVTATGNVEAALLTDGTATITGGDLSTTGNVSAADVTATGTVQFGNLSDGTISIESFIDDDSMATASATTVATSESVKAYVDAEVAASSSSANLSLAGDAGTGTVNLSTGALTVEGTANEIETSVAGNVITIGLPDDVTVAGNLSVSGSLLSDDITAATVNVNGDATITGNLTVQGTQTIVESTVVSTGDAVIRVNSDGAAVSAGIEANIGGTLESVVYVPGSSRWELSGDVYTAGSVTGGSFTDGTATLSSGNLSGAVNVTASGTIQFATLSDGTDSITSFVTAADTIASNDSDSSVPTTAAVIDYVSAQVTASVLSFTDDAATAGLEVNLSTETLTVAGGTNITTSGSGTTLTVDLDDSISLGNVTATGTVQGGTLTDGTASLTGGELSGLSNVTVGNININGNTISTLDTNGDLILAPNGTGDVIIGNAGVPAQVGAEDNQSLSLEGGASSTATDAGDLFLLGGDSSSTGNGGDVVLQAGTSTGGTAGTIQLKDTNDNIVVQVLDATAGSNTHIDVQAGSTSAFLTVDSTETDADITISPKGTGQILVPGSYVPTDANSLVDKAYVDSQLTSSALAFTADDATGGLTIDLDSETLTVAGGTNITTSSAGDTITVTLDDDVTLAGNLTAVNGTFTGDLGVTGTATVGTLTDGTATLTGGNFSGLGTVTATTLTDGTLSISAGDLSTTGNVSAADVTASGVVSFGDLTDGTITIGGFIDDNSMATASNTTLATASSVKSYVDAEVAASSSNANLSLVGDSGTGTVNLSSGALTVEGTANEIETSVAGNVITVGLPNDVIIAGNLTVNGEQVIVNSTVVNIDDAVVRVNSDGAAVSAGIEANVSGTIESVVYVPGSSRWELSGDVYTAGSVEGSSLTDGTATLSSGNISGAVNVTASGTVQFGTLSDGTDSITSFVTAADTIASNDNDTSVPTTAAVIDYVSNNSGDGLLLRGTFTANSTDSSFSVGTVPNVTNRTYYADKIVIKVNTAFSGGSFDHILVKDNNGTGTTLVASDDADGGVVATYVVELDGEAQLTKNATVDVLFVQVDGTTPAVVSAGAVTVAVHYNWV